MHCAVLIRSLVCSFYHRGCFKLIHPQKLTIFIIDCMMDVYKAVMNLMQAWLLSICMHVDKKTLERYHSKLPGKMSSWQAKYSSKRVPPQLNNQKRPLKRKPIWLYTD